MFSWVRVHPESCDAKTGLKMFVAVVPKEGLADTSPTKPSFGMTPSIKRDLRRQQSAFVEPPAKEG